MLQVNHVGNRKESEHRLYFLTSYMKSCLFSSLREKEIYETSTQLNFIVLFADKKGS